ncbi:MAG: imidazolonepropionase [Actinobacteria bacterium]|nr:imidazolonepropionase [Actinomycetota bacterium]
MGPAPSRAGGTSLSIEGAAQLMLMPEPGLPYLRHDAAGRVELVAGGLSVAGEEIASLLPDADAERRFNARGCAVIPGFVDCHTHLPFAGWRAGEYERKIAGVPYEEIARGGGGIKSSARAFGAASDREVLDQASALAAEMLRCGTTAFECKSGYGLGRDAELRALRLAAELRGRVSQTTTSTALLAHAVPPGFTADEWLDEVEAMLPEVRRDTIADTLDVYVESVAFTNAHLARIADLAAAEGLALRCHVEQFATHRSVPVALAHGARSVDHLACIDPDDIGPLAAAECATVLLPGAELLGDERVAPARELADAGAICVLATDANPGTSPIVSMPIVVGIAVRRYRWTVREALLAATLNAAWTMGLSRTHGSIERGKRADLVVLDGPVEMVPYRFGHDPVIAVIRAGEPVWIRPGHEWRLT